MPNISVIGVIGAGQMGAGIAQVFAMAGFDVVLQDVKEEFCKRGMKSVETSLAKMVEKEKTTEDIRKLALSKIKTTIKIDDIKGSDFVVEAATEDLELKKEIFKKLDKLLFQDKVLATNTSSISITKIAAVTNRPAKIIGMHFMNPVPLMEGVEVIRGLATDDQTEKIVAELIAKIGKTMVRSIDSAGFVSNRILTPMLNEAIYTLYEGVATREDIDACMKTCCNFPMGPLALADLIGLDTLLAILNVMHTELGDPKYRPCPLLRKYVDAGWLGRKTKRGFYEY